MMVLLEKNKNKRQFALGGKKLVVSINNFILLRKMKSVKDCLVLFLIPISLFPSKKHAAIFRVLASIILYMICLRKTTSEVKAW